MNNQGMFTLFVILVASISSVQTFAQIIEPVVVTTDKESYSEGENVVIVGEVKERLSGVPVSLQVIAANGNLVTIKQVEVDDNNKFATELMAGGELWKSSGIYTVKVLYGTESRTDETTFEFGSSYTKNTKIEGPSITVDNTDAVIGYKIINGKVINIAPIEDANSLVITLETTDSGELTVTLPRTLIDAKIGDADDDFFVLVDGEEVDFEEKITSMDRTLVISYPSGTEEIEIIGTFVVPEFGSIAVLILAVAVVSLILITSKSKLSVLVKH